MCERHLLTLLGEGDAIPLLHSLDLDSHPDVLKPQMSENQMTFSVALDCCVHLFTARFRTHSFQFESFFIEALHKYDYNLVTFGLTSDQAQGTLQSPNPMTD